MNTWTLGSGVELNRHHPDTFYIPDTEDKELLSAEDFVKLIFDISGGDVSAERMWVKVTHVSRDGSKLTGTLANTPVFIDGLKFGARITFSPDAIIDIDFAVARQLEGRTT